MDVQEHDPVNDLYIMTVEEASEVSLHFYEYGEDKDSDPRIEVFMNHQIDIYIVDTDSVDTLEEEIGFVDSDWKQYKGQFNYKKCTSYSITRLLQGKGIELTQIMLDPILLQMCTISGKRLPKARFVGRAPSIVYTPFSEFADPFIRHGYMYWNETRKDAYICLIAQFKQKFWRQNITIG